MELTKVVNGVVVPLTPEEALAIPAEWAAVNAKKEQYRLKEKYKADRRKEYPSSEELLIALWEKVIEDRPEAATALQVKREAVKIKYPKPEAN